VCARGPSSSRSPPSPKSRGPAANPPTSLNANPSVVHTNPAANTYADSTIGPYEKCSYRRRVPNSDPSPKVTVGPPSPISSTLRRTNRIAYRWKIPRKIPSGDVLAHFTPARNPPTKTGHRLRRGLQPPHPRLWRPGCAQVAPACASEKSTSPPPIGHLEITVDSANLPAVAATPVGGNDDGDRLLDDLFSDRPGGPPRISPRHVSPPRQSLPKAAKSGANASRNTPDPGG